MVVIFSKAIDVMKINLIRPLLIRMVLYLSVPLETFLEKSLMANY